MTPADAMRAAWRWLKSGLDSRARLAARVRAAKRARAASPLRYLDQPRVSLIVLSFNHRANAAAIVDGVRRTPADELIVCDDGSLDGADREWQRLLTRPNDFLVRSNDIHDSRIYNRAASLARGQIIAVLQDDDIPPQSGAWLEQALALFERYPKLEARGAGRPPGVDAGLVAAAGDGGAMARRLRLPRSPSLCLRARHSIP
jgi:glycosyltransferase involved in cell wall biosynthesis